MLNFMSSLADNAWNKRCARWILRGQSAWFVTARVFRLLGFTKFVRLLSAPFHRFTTTAVETFSSVRQRFSTGFDIHYDYVYIFDLNTIGAVK